VKKLHTEMRVMKLSEFMIYEQLHVPFIQGGEQDMFVLFPCHLPATESVLERFNDAKFNKLSLKNETS